ncbi:MAG TPA: hypothetical protein VLD67_01930 [Vicinamibacterales bacterium]|nr:hypothetical protein [Vicinamibacterales bacterium]
MIGVDRVPRHRRVWQRALGRGEQVEGAGAAVPVADRRPFPRTLIIVENLPVPFDTRVWNEAKTLTAAGGQVSVIYPKGKGWTR